MFFGPQDLTDVKNTLTLHGVSPLPSDASLEAVLGLLEAKIQNVVSSMLQDTASAAITRMTSTMSISDGEGSLNVSFAPLNEVVSFAVAAVMPPESPYSGTSLTPLELRLLLTSSEWQHCETYVLDTTKTMGDRVSLAVFLRELAMQPRVDPGGTFWQNGVTLLEALEILTTSRATRAGQGLLPE